MKMAGVDKVLMAVLLIITGKPNLSELKNTLSKPKNLKQFDLSLIETKFEQYQKICETYKGWYDKEKDVITLEGIRNKSIAIGGLYEWTINIMKYQEKIELVVPLKEEAKKAKDIADEMQKTLDEEMQK